MQLIVGQKASQTKKFSKEEVLNFSKLTSDDNPIHFDEQYASKTRFKKTIVQGPMVVSLIGGILGSTLPGPGTIYISQETKFLKPLFIEETVTAWVEIIKIRDDKPIITLKNWIEKEDGEVVLEGQSVILFLENL
ncbi:MaoC family dehydratase [Zunongwangia sp. F260]|uniref:MaoC family dehydratase n=1 Tax=Autumnicola lenta TaxID=3075593 RepID=A0ABU3CI63_9FLAO|nr:MaoC family dehydratase [Zunongwangia sp. F260]MDT0645913.1 MaoC family dehydratase [Zunongwangia sp. F260]